MEWVAAALESAATGVGTEALTNLIRTVAQLDGAWNALTLKAARRSPYVIVHAPHERHPRLPDALPFETGAPQWTIADGWAWLITPLPVPELYYVLRTRPEQQHRVEWRIAAQLATLLGQHESFHREIEALKRLSRQRLTALGTLYETAVASEQGGLEPFLQLATRRAAQAMEAQACTLMLLDEATQTLAIAANYGLPDKLIEQACVRLGEGVAGYVAQTGEPLLLNDLEQEPNLRHLTPRAHISSSISVPLRNHENAVIGVLSIRRLHPAPPFTQEELRLFAVFANQIASALENARLYQQLKQNLHRLSTLVRLTHTITAELNIDKLLEQVGKSISDTVGFSRCAIFLSGESSGFYQQRFIRGYHPEMFPARGFRKGQSVIGTVIDDKTPQVVRDARRESSQVRGFARALGTNCYCALPIVVHDNCIGVVLADNQNEPFTDEQVELLSAFVNQAGVAIANARLYQDRERRYQELQSLAAFRNNILRSLGSGMFTVDENGIITTWNRAARQILGVLWRQSVGRHYREVLEADSCPIARSDCQVLQTVIEQVLQTPTTRNLYKLTAHVGNARRVLNATISPLLARGRQPQGAVVLFEDITEYLNLESRLSEMERLAAVGQMTATIAHEIRNPLTALRGAVELMRQEEPLPESLSMYIEVIQQEAQRLTEIAEEFLEFAKPFYLQIRPTPLKPLLQRVLLVQSHTMQSMRVRTVLDAPDDLTAPADIGRLEQALHNLIQNAAHAMPDGGSVTLTAREHDEWITIAVQDTGAGVSPEIRDKIFTPFFTTRTRGTGLGLSIVKKIIEGHGGKVTLECPPEGGSIFTLWLPKIQPTA
ncbi:MAG: GAF domain-containing protein [Fimbriimonadales bacterium]